MFKFDNSFQENFTINYHVQNNLITYLEDDNNTIEQRDYTIIELFEKHNNIYVGRSKSLYDSKKNHLFNFLRLQGKENILAKNFNKGLVIEFEAYLQNELKFSHNHKVRILQSVKKVLRFGYESELLQKNNLRFVKWSKNKASFPIFLAADELQRIKDIKLIGRLERVRDCFLFACFTGLAFVDLAKISQKNIYVGTDGREWIRIERQKTKVISNLPFLEVAKSILKKYKGVLPVLCNQRYNAYLKEIADLARIDKKLTTHVARKTFANLALNVWNVSYEVLAVMLGHSDTKVTQQAYAKMTEGRVSKEMNNVR